MNQYFEPRSGAKPIKLAFVEIKQMHVPMEIGIAPNEKGKTQRITFDVQVGFDDAKTNLVDSADGLRHGFNYVHLRDCILEACRPETHLLETLANRIADSIMRLPDAVTLKMQVTKHRPFPDVEEIQMTVTR